MSALIVLSPRVATASPRATAICFLSNHSRLSRAVTVSGAVGQQWLDVSDDYVTWNLGAAYAVTDNLTLDLRYHDTDIDGLAIAEDRYVATVKAAF